MFKSFTLIILMVWFFLLFPSNSEAALVYLETSDSSYNIGDVFSVNVMIDKINECLNTASINIGFPENILEFVDFSTGESLLSLWLDVPRSEDVSHINKNGHFNFTGGVPGGYCGKIPGDPGVSNKLGTIFFKVKDNATSTAKINILNDSQVFLNDGYGTRDKLKVKNLEINIFNDSLTSPQKKWFEFLKNDKIAPEPFVVELHQNSNMFEGAYYIIFSTTDKQSGLDHYEVLEMKSEEQLGVETKKGLLDVVFGHKNRTPNWKKVKSMPYRLEDQSLESIIKVKAVDKAGNERIVEYVPPANKRPASQKQFMDAKLVLVLLFIIVLILVALLFRKKRANKV